MTEQQLLYALQNVDGKYTDEAYARAASAGAAKSRSRRISVILTAAGAAACFVCTGTALFLKNQDEMLTAGTDSMEEMVAEQFAEVTTAADSADASFRTAETTAANLTKKQSTETGAANTLNAVSDKKNSNETQPASSANAAGRNAGKTNGNGTSAKDSASDKKTQQAVIIPTAQRNGYVTTPDFTGKSFAEAKKLANSLDLKLSKKRRNSALAKDTVIAQLTDAGRQVPVGTELEVEVATGGNEASIRLDIPSDMQKVFDYFEVVLYDQDNHAYISHFANVLTDRQWEENDLYGYSFMPASTPAHYVSLDLIGTGTADVTAYLVHGEYHFFPETLDPGTHPEYAKIGTYHIDYDRKTVTAKNEDIAGAFRKVARTSKPDDIYEIPDFIGMTWEQAQKAAEDSPLDLAVFKKNVESDKPEGTVVAQTLEPGTEASTKPGLVNKVIELSVSTGAKKEIRFVLPHRNGLENYPILNYPFMIDETYIPTPLDGIEAYLYELDANGKRTGKKAYTKEDYYFTEIFWDTGVKDYEVILHNAYTGEEAKAGTYRLNFGSQSYQLISGDVDAAFRALTSPLPDLVGKNWSEAAAAAEKAGIHLKKVEVSNGAPAGTIVYQPFETGEQITKGNTVPVEVSDGNGDLTPISFTLTIPAGYTGEYSVIGFKQDDDASYTTPFVEFDAAEANGSIQITMSGIGEGDFIMTLVKGGDSAQLGVLRINFEKQTVEIIEDNMDAAFRKLNT